MKRLLLIASVAITSAAIAGCGGGDSGSGTSERPGPPPEPIAAPGADAAPTQQQNPGGSD